MIVDIIILGVIILSIILGKNKGITVCLVKIFDVIVAVIIALMFCRPVANYIIEKTPVGENLKQTVKKSIPMNDGEITIDENSNLPKAMKEYINNQVKNVNDTKDNVIESISQEITQEIVTVISFIGIFIIVRAVLLIIKIVSKIINKLPILKQIDHLGGAICGAVEGIIAVYCILAVISIISPVIENTQILNQINNSYIGKAMYNNNIIVKKLQ